MAILNLYSIFWPLIILVAITGMVWVLMYVRRLSEISRNNIDPQSLATSDLAQNKLRDVSAADNFANLLETPVLFYTLCLALFVTNEASQTQLTLAWLYVILRALHSLVHVTYNNVVHRWAVYMLSTICLFVMWAMFALSLLARHVG